MTRIRFFELIKITAYFLFALLIIIKWLNQTETENRNHAFFKKSVLGNYEEANYEKREGPGENGTAVHIEPYAYYRANVSIAEFGFNMIASNKISLDRRIADSRPHECKYFHYPEASKLPKASVIIVFVNEGWSTLMRTVHSVINTSPPELLQEIILVDDFSNKAHLKEKLENYIRRFRKVKLYRNSQREGIARARVIGAQKATGDVIVILDAHCECVTNWLPPLLTRIAANRKTLAVPIVDRIDWNTFEHSKMYGDYPERGFWDWSMIYIEKEVPEKELEKNRTEPFRSPTHAGGLLAIDKSWFFELGGYDPGIKSWGGEQYELSFKVWQCGGVVEFVPCSHVAHIYRQLKSELIHPPGGNFFQKSINLMRVAEVWMDEYKQYFYTREPQTRRLKFGNISSQLAIKERLKCKSFKWFMDNVAYGLLDFIPLPPQNQIWGEVKNVKHNVCMDHMAAGYNDPIGIDECIKRFTTQLFILNVKGEISFEMNCVKSRDKQIILKYCLNFNGFWNQTGEWQYNSKTQMIKSRETNTCITTDGIDLFLKKCDDLDEEQKWEWNEIYYSDNFESVTAKSQKAHSFPV